MNNKSTSDNSYSENIFYVTNINHCDNLFEKGVGFMMLSHVLIHLLIQL